MIKIAEDKHKINGGMVLTLVAVPLSVGVLLAPMTVSRRSERATVMAADRCWNPPCREEIPHRWRKLHDCDRPIRWRELLDEEDCRIYDLHRDEFEAGPGAAVLIAEKRAAADVASVDSMLAPSRSYKELVPSLSTVDDFLAANERGRQTGRLVVVKFYSKKCRACLRIAALYRRLALDLRDSVDLYEAESSAAEDLCDRLDVASVPSVQIFDGEDITRLGMFVCKPAEWKRVDAKVRVAMVSYKKRRTLHKLFGEPLLDILTVPLL